MDKSLILELSKWDRWPHTDFETLGKRVFQIAPGDVFLIDIPRRMGKTRLCNFLYKCGWDPKAYDVCTLETISNPTKRTILLVDNFDQLDEDAWDRTISRVVDAKGRVMVFGTDISFSPLLGTPGTKLMGFYFSR